MMLPAAASRFWVRGLEGMCALAVGFGMVSSYFGLLISYYLGVASGPSIILVAGGIYVVSLFFGRRGVIFTRVQAPRHRVA
jgi:zinc/manganese transport system permease protein